MRRITAGTVAVLSTALLAAVVPGSAASPVAHGDADAGAQAGLVDVSKARSAAVRLRFRKVSSAFSQPTHVTSANDGRSRMFVVERTGRIRVFRDGKARTKPYLDIRGRVNSGSGEQGLLGLAFAPDFRKRPRFYVAFTDGSGALRVVRFSAESAGAATARRGSARLVLRVPHPGNTNHNGGMLAFGLDGHLYIGTGDGGGGGDPGNNAQDRTSLLGKILRVDVSRACGSKAYCVPGTNPYAGSVRGRGEIWATGVRNPWRFSFDRANGDLWIGDVGQGRYEEVDRIRAGRAGVNLGWPCREGRSVYDASRCRSGVTYAGPVTQYGRSAGQSITGGYVYRGSRWSSLLRGKYVFADFLSGRVWTTTAGGTRRLVGSLPTVTSFGVDDGGEIWAVTYGGGLHRLRATSA